MNGLSPDIHEETLSEDLIDEELSSLRQEITENVDKQPQSKYKEMIEKQRGPVTHGNREKPEISITFDDGYGDDNIKHILDTLKGSGIHATFFILGDCLRDSPSLRKQAVNEGHQVCCHTFSHIYLSDSEYTDLGDKKSGISAGPGYLNKTDLNEWTNNVRLLLGDDYLKNLRIKSGNGFPRKVKTDLLLRTEILMWESQIKKTLGNDYLKNFKLNHPFFRFPGGCGDHSTRNINILKELGYLSIGWSEDFFRGRGDTRRHMSLDSVRNVNISNGDIPLFHFKKSYGAKRTTEWQYIDAYIENMKNRNKTSHEVSHIIK